MASTYIGQNFPWIVGSSITLSLLDFIVRMDCFGNNFLDRVQLKLYFGQQKEKKKNQHRLGRFRIV